MAARLCGYCRQDGHRADKCAEKANLRTEILTYIPKERKVILDLMVKNGYGEGATFTVNDWYSNTTRTFILTDADFVTRWQFGSQKRVKYSKQLRFTPHSPIERDQSGNIADVRYQYEHLTLNALMFGNGNSSLTEVRIPIRCVLQPIMLDSGVPVDNREPRMLEMSHKPFDINPALFAKDIKVHKRIAENLSRRTGDWDDTYYENGIIPA